MRIGIYSPYLDTAGGGEKYMLTIAQTLSDENEVDVFLDKHLAQMDIKKIKDVNERLHDLDLSKINFIPAPVGSGSPFFERISFLKKYDFMFYNTDGSIFLSTAKNSIIHFQIPFQNIAAKGVWGKIKLSSWKKAIYNSLFTKEIIESGWSIKGDVLYPPVSIDLFSPAKKKNQIISVGRFAGHTKSKKHELMITTFKELVDKNKRQDLSLHLAGGVVEGSEPYVEELKSLAKGYKVYFYPNISIKDLVKLYGESKVYWHAAGFGEDDPAKHEHFGITTVEAMAAGCVPVVINKGGQKEIVENGISGYLWDDVSDWVSKTLQVIDDETLAKKLQDKATERAKLFSKEEFERKIHAIVSKA